MCFIKKIHKYEKKRNEFIIIFYNVPHGSVLVKSGTIYAYHRKDLKRFSFQILCIRHAI